MQIALAIVPVLFSSLLVAQTAQVSQTSAQHSLPVLMKPVDACPVSISVKHEGQGTVLDARLSGQSSGRRSAGPNANHGLGVTIAGGNGAIKALDFVVYGMAAGMHIIPATANAQEIEETVHLGDFNGQPVNDMKLMTTRVAVISRVRLTGIEYSDGMTWHADSASECVASPSLFVPVNSAAH